MNSGAFSKRGVLFLFDSLIACVILLICFLIIFSNFTTTQSDFTLDDVAYNHIFALKNSGVAADGLTSALALEYYLNSSVAYSYCANISVTNSAGSLINSVQSNCSITTPSVNVRGTFSANSSIYYIGVKLWYR